MMFQDKDLKQYLDDCGNIIHVHNVKVRKLFMYLSVLLILLFPNTAVTQIFTLCQHCQSDLYCCIESMQSFHCSLRHLEHLYLCAGVSTLCNDTAKTLVGNGLASHTHTHTHISVRTVCL